MFNSYSDILHSHLLRTYFAIVTIFERSVTMVVDYRTI